MASRKDVRFRMTARDETGTGIRSAETRFQRLRRSVSGIGAAITRGFAGLGVAIGGIGIAIVKVSEQIDRLVKKARELDIKPSLARELEGVAALTGLADDALFRLVSRFNQGTTEINEALQAIGINLEPFRNLKADQQLAVVINQLEKIPSQADRVAAATALAGERLGRQLTLLANSGAAQFQTLIDQQRRLGSEVFDQAATQTEQALDNVSRLKAFLGNIATGLVADGNKIANGFLEWAGASKLWADRTIVNVEKVREATGLLRDETIAAATFTFQSKGDIKALEDAKKLADSFFDSMKDADDAAFKAFQTWSRETTRQQERLLDNLITRLERVRDSLREDQAQTFDLRDRRIARASAPLTLAQDVLTLKEQQKTNKLLTELVRFGRTGNPAVFG